MWKRGTVMSEQVAGGSVSGFTPLSAPIIMLRRPFSIASWTKPQMPRWLLTAPLGRPVVPLV